MDLDAMRAHHIALVVLVTSWRTRARASAAACRGFAKRPNSVGELLACIIFPTLTAHRCACRCPRLQAGAMPRTAAKRNKPHLFSAACFFYDR